MTISRNVAVMSMERSRATDTSDTLRGCRDGSSTDVLRIGVSAEFGGLVMHESEPPGEGVPVYCLVMT